MIRQMVSILQLKNGGRQAMPLIFCVCFMLALLGATSVAHAGITYDSETSTVIVVDFSESVPCRPENILRADRMNSWNVMKYDESNDTYELKANLQIGLNNKTNTYFQIGSEKNLGETLRVVGNLIIYPEYVKGENESKGRDWINSLTVGVPGNEESKACLRIINGDKTNNSIYIARIPKPDGGFLHKPFTAFGGTFKVCNGTVGGESNNPKQTMGQPLLFARKVFMKNAIIENFKGCFTTGCFPKITDISDTVFRNGDIVMQNPGFDTENCTFEKIGRVISGFGGQIRIVLKNCIFKDNGMNFQIDYRGSMVVLVDCDVSKAQRPDSFQDKSRGSKKQPPAILLSRKNQKFIVTSTDNSPLAGVKIHITANNADSSLYSKSEATVTTGNDGVATALLDTASKSTVEGEKVPQTKIYEYRVQVSGKGYSDTIIPVFNPHAQQEALSIKMEKK